MGFEVGDDADKNGMGIGRVEDCWPVPALGDVVFCSKIPMKKKAKVILLKKIATEQIDFLCGSVSRYQTFSSSEEEGGGTDLRGHKGWEDVSQNFSPCLGGCPKEIKDSWNKCHEESQKREDETGDAHSSSKGESRTEGRAKKGKVLKSFDVWVRSREKSALCKGRGPAGQRMPPLEARETFEKKLGQDAGEG